MLIFPVQCFSKRLPSEGGKGSLSLNGDTFSLYIENISWTTSFPLDSVEIISGGFDHQQLILSWRQDDTEWSAMILTASDREIFIKQAPDAIKQKLTGWQKKTRKTNRIFRIFLWASLILFLLPWVSVPFLWWQSEYIVNLITDRVPIEFEESLGAAAWKQVSLIHPPIDTNTPLHKAIQEIGERLTKGSRYKYKWHIVEDDSINAFAMPGGHVVINIGLINTSDSAEEAAGVIAHEVQHIEERHTLQAIIHSLGWRGVLSAVFGDINASVWANIASELGQLKFSRIQETIADEKGLNSLVHAKINPKGMITFFEKLYREDESTVSILATHPETKERLAYLKKLLPEEKIAFDPLPYDWQSLKTAKRYQIL